MKKIILPNDLLLIKDDHMSIFLGEPILENKILVFDISVFGVSKTPGMSWDIHGFFAHFNKK